jgi:Sulfotransferase domain
VHTVGAIVLVYLSSYPRSGNTWIRQLVRHYFGYQAASIYPEPQGAPNLEIRADGTFELFSTYEVPYPPGTLRRMLVNACGPILSEELRQQLAQSQEVFFLKTHEPPFDRYFAGEYVVHIIREPGAVFWSYYNFLRKNEPARYSNLSLNQVIKGRVPFGSWSDHGRKWLAAQEQLGARFMLYTYEDLSTKPETEFCDGVTAFTGVPYRMTKRPLPSLEHWHQEAPTLYRKEKIAAWKPHFSAAQLHRILKRHERMMLRFDYNTAAYQTSLRDRIRSILSFSGKPPQPTAT